MVDAGSNNTDPKKPDESKNGRPGGKRNNYRRGGRNRPRRFSTAEDVKVCPFCGQNVREVLTAIALDNTGEMAHFDCVVKKITLEEKPKNKEKVCYLGKGEFGIIRPKNGGNKFEILKRISFENLENTPDWRKNISKRIKK